MAMVIQYTRTVKVCLEDIVSHLRRIEVEPKEVISGIIEHFESRINEFPLACQICPELLKIGCAKYRECNTPDGYRVLYSIEDDIITTHAILSDKQDVQNLLFKRLISL